MSLTKGEQVYLDLVQHLKDDAEARVNLLTAGAFDGDTPDVMDVESIDSQSEIDQAFDREALDSKFLSEQEALSAAVKLGIASQNDFIASLHKASTLRFRPRIQSMILGGLRDSGQTQAHGYLKFVLDQVPLMEQVDAGGENGDE